MRSLSLKLIAAFVVIGLVSILSIMLLARWNTRTEFDRFILDRRGQEVLAGLQQYYAANGSWQGLDNTLSVGGAFSGTPSETAPRPPFTVVDLDSKAVLQGEFPEIAARVNIQLPDEKSRRVGQSIAAASLPAVAKQR